MFHSKPNLSLKTFRKLGEDLFNLIVRDFARQSIGAMIVGIACGGMAVIYQFNRPSGLTKVIFSIINFCYSYSLLHINLLLFTVERFLNDNFLRLNTTSIFLFHLPQPLINL